MDAGNTPDADGQFDNVLSFYVFEGALKFDNNWADNPNENYGSAFVVLPEFLNNPKWLHSGAFLGHGKTFPSFQRSHPTAKHLADLIKTRDKLKIRFRRYGLEFLGKTQQ